MGNFVTVDGSPQQLPKLIEDAKIKAKEKQTNGNRALKQLPYVSNLKIWCASIPEEFADPKLEPILINKEDFSFSSKNSYLVLHLYKKKFEKTYAELNGVASPPHSQSQHKSSLLKLAMNATEKLTPRGLEHSFSLNSTASSLSICGNHKNDESVSYDLYLFRGKEVEPLIQAYAVTKCFELERILLDPYLPDALFEIGNPIALKHLFMDDVSLSKGSTKKPQYISLYQHCHLFRTLMCAIEQNHHDKFPPSILSSPSGLSLRNLLHLPNLKTSPEKLTASPELDTGSMSPDSSPRSSQSTPRSAPRSIPPINFNQPSLPSQPLQPSKEKKSFQNRKKQSSDRKRAAEGVPELFCEPKKPTLSSRSSPRTPLTSGSNSNSSRSFSRLDFSSVDRSGDNVDPSPTPRSNSFAISKCMSPKMSGAEKIVVYRKICSRITDYMYLGSDVVARNKDQLLSNKITHVLNAALLACDVYFPKDFQYLGLNIYDSGEESIIGLFLSIVDFVESAHKQNGRVFVHCHEGVSRSSTMVIAYRMWKEKQPFRLINDDIKAKRDVCNPNSGFIVQLLHWEKLLTSPQIHLFRIAPINDRFSKHRQVAAKPCNNNTIDSRTSFVLYNSKSKIIYEWHGKQSNQTLQKEGERFAKLLQTYLAPDANIVSMNEGEESPDFAESLQQLEINKLLPLDQYKDLQYLDNSSDIYGIADAVALHLKKKEKEELEEAEQEMDVDEESADGNLYEYQDDTSQWEEIEHFDSQDMLDDKAYILCSADKDILFVWVGLDVNITNGNGRDEYALNLCKQFIKTYSLPENIEIEIVEPGEEPDNFWIYFKDG